MKVIIFGATGKVGRQLTAQALSEGHDVTAFVRKQSGDLGEDPKLRHHLGDVLNPADVAAAIKDHDAVFVALGKPLRNKDRLRTRGTANIIAAMQQHGPRRLVCLSGYGAGESYAKLPRFYRWVIMPLVLNHVYADHEEQEKLVRASGLDWTLVRPSNLFDGPRTDSYRIDFDKVEKGMKFKISFKDVAHFMLGQLITRSHLKAATAISS
ncbi:Putative NADH-flavin reductase [Cohaesibacter sp. ES.047]|uniref:NAD(P)-dependent oxidoreductase n=1 Tax=Cohaesibacter sp. ES.047 TaxID=1798205 RepID=UPI000BB8D8C6|nr:NAD(P)-binding oxidoreductase [Cohaesibacter sp. ES.047]SNY92626.1 Putative NADH-flavin reductase [Cohaesibacter sp. ES.047]